MMADIQASIVASEALGEKKSPFPLMDEKRPFIIANFTKNPTPRRFLYGLVLCLLALSGFLFKLTASIFNAQGSDGNDFAANSKFSPALIDHQQCLQAEPLEPSYTTDALKELDEILLSESYEEKSASFLSESIKYQTVSYENMTDPDLSLNDSLYDPFLQFYHKFICSNFPKFSKTLALKRVNGHGLLFTWNGTNKELKPNLLMAHQDVVPVEEVSEEDWTYEPWSGEIADGKVWGRGAYDTKHTLVSILEAVEGLLNASFVPKRTLLLSFGHDEELGGAKGGKLLAQAILDDHQDGTALLVDEGSVQFPLWGADMVMIGTTEKDRMPLYIEIRTEGGHASQPVEHTAIGVMSQIVVELEDLQYNTYLSEGHPLLDFLICSQEHVRGFPESLNILLNERLNGDDPPTDQDMLAQEFVNKSEFLQGAVKWSLTTAKSVNIIQGGVKGNSLPESVMTTSDIRIHIAETVQSTRNNISKIVRDVAESHELKFVDFDGTDEETPDKSIRVWAGGIGEIPKVSPSKVILGKDTPWSVVAGTTRYILGSNTTVVPGMSPGNTDAKWFPNVTDYIYRYSPGGSLVDSLNMHTVDEAISIKSHTKGVRWYSNFIRNMDEAVLD